MTLRELAERLGLSQTTVSRALNGYPEVSETTRAKVVAEARRMQYSPDVRARSLATGRSMVIGHVIPAVNQHEMVNPVFADFIAGAGLVYQAAGYDLMLTLVSDFDEERIYRGVAARGRVDGFVVQAPRPDDPRIALLHELRLPFVVHGRANEEDRHYSWIDMDNAGAFRQATERLIGLGHRRIALINGPERLNFAIMRRRGFQAAMDAAGLPVPAGHVSSGRMSETVGHALASRMLDETGPPTAFLASSILMAMGIRRAAAERGLALGRDLSVIAHDDGLSYLPNESAGAPQFTATRAPISEAGRMAAEILLAAISSPDSGPRHKLQTTEMVDGPTTAPPPSSR